MTVNLTTRTMHTFFPRVVLVILAILGVVLIIQWVLKHKKAGTPLFDFKNFHFFAPGSDLVKFWGAIILTALYIYCLQPMHFVPASILFIFLLNVLFSDAINLKVIAKKEEGQAINLKSLLVSAVISVVAPVLIYLLFHDVFHRPMP